MKKLIAIMACAAAVAGCCEKRDDGTFTAFGSDLNVFTVRGHDYLVASCVHGVALVHAASCPCQERGEAK